MSIIAVSAIAGISVRLLRRQSWVIWWAWATTTRYDTESCLWTSSVTSVSSLHTLGDESEYMHVMLTILAHGHAHLSSSCNRDANVNENPRSLVTEVWEQRKAQSLPLRSVLLHAGYMKGEAKTQQFKDMGLWAADKWDPSMAPAVLKKRLRKGGFGRAGLLRALVIVGGLAGIGAWGWRRGVNSALVQSAIQGQRKWRRPGPVSNGL